MFGTLKKKIVKNASEPKSQLSSKSQCLPLLWLAKTNLLLE